MEICYRVCDRNGWSKHDSLEHLDAYLTSVMAGGIAFWFWPIKRIVKVTSEDVPFTETVRRYNDWVAESKKKEGGKE